MNNDVPDDMTASDYWMAKQNVWRVGYSKKDKLFLSSLAAVMMVVISTICVLDLITGGTSTMVQFIVFTTFMVLMDTGMIALILEVNTTWYEIDDQSIVGHGVFHRHFSIKWSDISFIFSDITRSHRAGPGLVLTVCCEQIKVKFEVGPYTEVGKFAYLVKKHLPEDKWEKIRQIIREQAFFYEKENGIAHKVRVNNDQKPGTGASG